MELTEEQITELGLSEENAPKVSSFLAEQIATTKQSFEGLANENAEKILTGASKKIFDDTKVERQQGEKVGDYLTRAWSEFNANRLTEVNRLKTDYETKIKGFKGNEDLISKITNLEGEKDTLLQKYANYDELKDKAEKYDPLAEKYDATKKQVAFNSIKPNFPKEVNKYEADVKWKAFQKSILDNYSIEIVDGEPIAISNENEHRRLKLSDLLTKDESITSLMQGRQQQGTGSQQANLADIEGVPFKVPEGADTQVRTKLIKEYLTSEKGMNPMSAEYTKEFARINKAIINKK